MNVKERLIRRIQASDKPVSRRLLIEAFDKSRRAIASQELSNLIGAGYVCVIGTGRRGSPFMIVRNKTWPFDKCPLCGLVDDNHVEPSPKTN